MSPYRAMILEDTRCTTDDAGLIEHIMREDVFHSTLDWQKEERDAYQQETGKAFDLAEYRLRIARELLGEKLPAGTTGADLRGQELARVFRDVIHNVIEEQVSLRNTALSDDQKVRYRQLFHFRYKDGAQMVTVGGLLHRASEEDRYLACGFGTLPFIRTGADPCSINAPTISRVRDRPLRASTMASQRAEADQSQAENGH